MPLFEAARAVVETDELKPKARGSLRDLVLQFDRWRAQSEVTSHTELAEIVLDESGYTDMWQKDRSADAAGRLENLKELIRSMEEFENLQGFLEHISLVMDREGGAEDEAVSLMTLHSAKGLEFDNVFLPGWEEGLFPSQRTLDEQGRAGPRGRAPPRPCRPDPRPAPRKNLLCHQPPHPRHLVDHDPLALPRRTAGAQCRDHGIQGRLRLGRQRRLRSVALRQCGIVRLELHHAGLAARPGQPRPQPRRPGPRRLQRGPVVVLRPAAASRATSAGPW